MVHGVLLPSQLYVPAPSGASLILLGLLVIIRGTCGHFVSSFVPGRLLLFIGSVGACFVAMALWFGNRPVMPIMTRDKTGTSRDKTRTNRDKMGTSRDKTWTK